MKATETDETVVETVIDVTHAVIGIPLMLKTTVALEETFTAEVGALALDQDRLMVTDTTDPVAIDLVAMKMIELEIEVPVVAMKRIKFEIEVPAVSATWNESARPALSASRLHHSPRKTSVIGGRCLCSSWLLD